MNEENLRRYMPHLAASLAGPNTKNIIKSIKSPDVEYDNIKDIIRDQPSTRHVRNYYRMVVDKIINEKNIEREEFLDNFDQN